MKAIWRPLVQVSRLSHPSGLDSSLCIGRARIRVGSPVVVASTLSGTGIVLRSILSFAEERKSRVNTVKEV